MGYEGKLHARGSPVPTAAERPLNTMLTARALKEYAAAVVHDVAARRGTEPAPYSDEGASPASPTLPGTWQPRSVRGWGR